MQKNKINTYSSLDKIFSSTGPMLSSEFSSSMLIDEIYSFQVAFIAEKSHNFAKLTCISDFSGQIDIKVVREIIATKEHGLDCDDYTISREDKMYPEVLEDRSALYTIKDNWHVFWITLKNTNNQKGIFQLNFILSLDGHTISNCEYNLEIIPVKLAPNDLIITHWMHYDCICHKHNVQMFSEEFYKIFEKYLDAYVLGGNTMLLTPVITPALDTEVGAERLTAQLVKISKNGNKYLFNFELLNSFIDFVVERGIKYFEIAHLFTQWGAEFCPKIIAEVDGIQTRIFGWDTTATSKEYFEFLEQFLPALYDFTNKKNISDKCFYHLSDEPFVENLDHYSNLYNKVKSIVPNITIIDALSNYDFYERKIVDIPVTASNHAEKFLQNNVKHIPYFCCSQCKDYVANRFFAMPSERSRVLGIQMYLNNALGFLQWGFNFYYSQFSKKVIDPYQETSAGNAFPSGDAFLVYPDKDAVNLSTRFFVHLEAIQDFRALKTLEASIGKIKVQELLISEGVSGYATYPKSPIWLKNFRISVNNIIKKNLV